MKIKKCEFCARVSVRTDEFPGRCFDHMDPAIGSDRWNRENAVPQEAPIADGGPDLDQYEGGQS